VGERKNGKRVKRILSVSFLEVLVDNTVSSYMLFVQLLFIFCLHCQCLYFSLIVHMCDVYRFRWRL